MTVLCGTQAEITNGKDIDKAATIITGLRHTYHTKNMARLYRRGVVIVVQMLVLYTTCLKMVLCITQVTITHGIPTAGMLMIIQT